MDRVTGGAREVTNPADRRDVVGTVIEATPELVDAACALARPWQEPPAVRAAILRKAADLMEARLKPSLGPIVREAGKTFGNAVGEVREAVDFLRYYAGCIEGFSNDTHRPLGLVACISPWNFPLSIFTGQIAGALAAGNAVIAKPAEETPLIAAQAVALLHEAGVPREALQLLPGDGTVGGRLVGNRRGRGRGVHRLDRGGALDQQAARPAPLRRRQAADPDRRDRRPERAGGRFLGAARAARARRPDLGLRFGRPALLGAARALPAGRHRRSRAAHAGRRDGRAFGSAIRIACRSMSVR